LPPHIEAATLPNEAQGPENGAAWLRYMKFAILQLAHVAASAPRRIASATDS